MLAKNLIGSGAESFRAALGVILRRHGRTQVKEFNKAVLAFLKGCSCNFHNHMLASKGAFKQ